MQKYGPTLLTSLVATKEDLDKLIVITEKLPAVSDVTEGAIMQLTKSQPGYTATHFYRAESNQWIDITAQCGPIDRIAKDSKGDTLHLSCEYEFMMPLGEESYYTGYLLLWWDQEDDTNHPAGDLVFEIVTRKFNDYPKTPTDGEIVVQAPKGVKYPTEDTAYKFDDAAFGRDTPGKYFYRVFHVHETGWYSYTDGPVLNEKI